MTNGPKPLTFNQLLLNKEKQAAETIYLRQPKNGVWHEYTWSEVILSARKVAAFLLHAGLKKGSHVSIISKNCAEWFIADFGIVLAGMVSVPLFSNQHVESIHYVLEHAEVEYVFVGKLDDHKQVRSNIPAKYKTISFDYHKDLKVDHSWSEVLASEPLTEVHEPKPEDLFTIIYSSGTSGFPRGAAYTHESIAQYLELFPKDLDRIQKLPNYKLISYLPLAHVYERSAIELSSVAINAEVSFVESLEKFAQNLQEVQPTLFAAVPRIWGVFQQKVEQKISPHVLRFILKVPFLSHLIKKKVKHGMGFSDCTNYFSGASYLPLSIINFFKALGISIQEGYGQTENMAYATVAMLDDYRAGYVGSARLGVSVKLSEEGELLTKSSCMMSEYFKDKESTEKAFTKDGFLRTGDLAEMDSSGRVRILGRISETFKNQTGEFVSPGPIEKKFESNKYIEQLCLVGRGLSSNVLVLTLKEGVSEQAEKQKINDLFQKQLRKVNKSLVKYEKIGHIVVVKGAWTPQNELLTPTLKVKRKVVEQHYADLIQSAFETHQQILWE